MKPEQLYEILQSFPGLLPKELARAAGIESNRVPRELIKLELNGYLVSEDDHGRLYPVEPERTS